MFMQSRSSLEAVLLVLSYEQLRLVSYKDAVGISTIGWGHVVRPDERSFLSGEITRETANKLFIEDFLSHEQAVIRAVGKRELTPDQLGACTSLCFNIGAQAFRESTLAKNIMAGLYERVPDCFRMWVKGTIGGKKATLNGLVARRESEVKLWEKG